MLGSATGVFCCIPDRLTDIRCCRAAECTRGLNRSKTATRFASEPVSEDDIRQILLAGLDAPTARSSQPWHLSVVTDKEILNEISAGMTAGMAASGPGGPGVQGASGGSAVQAPQSLRLLQGWQAVQVIQVFRAPRVL
jgi:nitroreductase